MDFNTLRQIANESERTSALCGIFNEDSRLNHSNAAKVEFITTVKFSQDAKDYAKENNVVLVDGEKLADLMIEYGVGVSTVQTYEIKKLDSDFFEER